MGKNEGEWAMQKYLKLCVCGPQRGMATECTPRACVVLEKRPDVVFPRKAKEDLRHCTFVQYILYNPRLQNILCLRTEPSTSWGDANRDPNPYDGAVCTYENPFLYLALSCW